MAREVRKHHVFVDQGRQPGDRCRGGCRHGLVGRDSGQWDGDAGVAEEEKKEPRWGWGLGRKNTYHTLGIMLQSLGLHYSVFLSSFYNLT